MLAPFSGPWLVCTTKVYPGLGADIVMESITLKPSMSVIAMVEKELDGTSIKKMVKIQIVPNP
jgi:hypothetical protein